MRLAKKSTSSRLRHKLTLQEEVQNSDGAGGTIKSWQDVADLWAEIIPINTLSGAASKKLLFGGQIQSEISHKVMVRYREGITPAMRLVFDSRIFSIRYVANIEERRESLELFVQEGTAT